MQPQHQLVLLWTAFIDRHTSAADSSHQYYVWRQSVFWRWSSCLERSSRCLARSCTEHTDILRTVENVLFCLTTAHLMFKVRLINALYHYHYHCMVMSWWFGTAAVPYVVCSMMIGLLNNGYASYHYFVRIFFKFHDVACPLDWLDENLTFLLLLFYSLQLELNPGHLDEVWLCCCLYRITYTSPL